MAKRGIDPTTEYGRQLEKERDNRSLNRGEWARLLDVSRQQYGNWLRGAEPGVDQIRHVAQVLGINVTHKKG